MERHDLARHDIHRQLVHTYMEARDGLRGKDTRNHNAWS